MAMNKVKRYIRNLRLTDAECRLLKQRAEACNMTQSAYLRSLLNDYQPKEKPPKEFYDNLQQLYGLLYQLSDDGVNTEVTEKVYDLLFEIEKKYIKPDKKRK